MAVQQPSTYVIGYPSYVEGADTEQWHTIKLWRAMGVGVNLIPTWHAPDDWRNRLLENGAVTHAVDSAGGFANVEGLAGSVVISYCNGRRHVHTVLLGSIVVYLNSLWLFLSK